MTLLAGLAAVSLIGHSADAQKFDHTFHISNSGAADPPDFPELSTLATQLVSQLTASYQGMPVTNAVWDELHVKQVSDGTTVDAPLVAIASPNLVGLRPVHTPLCPASLCMVLSLKTAAASRRSRGHIFLPPAWNTETLNGNVWATGSDYWLNAGPFALELKKGCIGGAGWTGSSLSHYKLAVFSRTAARALQPSVTECIDVVRRPKASFLRSRERGTT